MLILLRELRRNLPQRRERHQRHHVIRRDRLLPHRPKQRLQRLCKRHIRPRPNRTRTRRARLELLQRRVELGDRTDRLKRGVHVARIAQVLQSQRRSRRRKLRLWQILQKDNRLARSTRQRSSGSDHGDCLTGFDGEFGQVIGVFEQLGGDHDLHSIRGDTSDLVDGVFELFGRF